MPPLTGWKTRFGGVLRNLPKAVELLWAADRANALRIAVVTLVSSGVPVSQAWIAKLIVDGVIEAASSGRGPEAGLRAVLPYLGAEFGLIVFSQLLNHVRSLSTSLIELQLEYVCTERIVRKALALEVRYFEEARFYDQMQRARKESNYRAMEAVSSLAGVVQQVLTLASFLVLLVAFNPWIAAILLVAAIPSFVSQRRLSEQKFRMNTWKSPETRMMSYLEQVLTKDESVKEVKLFRLGQGLLGRYTAIFRRVFAEDKVLAIRRARWGLLFGLAAFASYYLCYAWIIYAAVGGAITIGGMTMYLVLFRQSQASFQTMIDSMARIYEHGLFLDNLFDFLALEPAEYPPPEPTRPAEDKALGIEFRDVWFRYPGREEYALSAVSLKIGPGEKLALVGENGAGKTTLIKLLTRLVEPERGQILLNGVDVRHFALDELHRRVGAIFQDFVRYQLSLKENIGFGWIDQAGDSARVLAAAGKSGADVVASTLEGAYDARLGRWFEGGQELSGGQWQKVALGRAFMSEGEVFILDEPTASLDAAAEYEVFQKFRALTAGKIAFLVSHRFSTVRMADRIAVLKGGRVEEVGTHAELVARAGTYSRLFELQAEGYR